MYFLHVVFWVSLAILFYSFVGYGILILCWNAIVKAVRPQREKPFNSELPIVTIIIAAYNEAAVLRAKLENTLAIAYPREKIEIILVTDGSTDGSEEIVREFPGVRLLHQVARQGKFAAISRAMEITTSPIVVFSDANTFLNTQCLHQMVRHYGHPTTGGVAGEKRINSAKIRSAVGEAEGIYWQYESFLKKQDAQFHSVVGAAGELFSIRTSLFQPAGKNIILDDFIISMRVCLQGYTIQYEPDAFATELPSASLKEETKRKIRIAAGAYQALGLLSQGLNFFKHPLLAFQYLSRRVLRWVCCPLLLIALLVSNIVLCNSIDSPLYFDIFLGAQITFYLLALIGGLLVSRGKPAGMLSVPFYFVFMNYCLVRGFVRFLRHNQTVLWERSARATGF
jgi:biofilm PGA synthesis N-glycosyltransferase PgaC